MKHTAVANGEVVRDALCELVNIGSGSALSSLVQLLGGGRIVPDVPQVVEADALSDFADLQRRGIAIRLGVEGEIPCCLLAVFDEASACKLASTLTHCSVDAIVRGSLEESALLETANIMFCAFLGALGRLVRGDLIPSPPDFEYGVLHIAVQKRVGDATVVTTHFADIAAGFAGRLLVVVDNQAAAQMAGAGGWRP